MDNRKWYQKLFGYCPKCGRWFRFDIERRRQNTAYVEEEANFVTCCAECFEEIEELWAYMWKEYNAMRL